MGAFSKGITRLGGERKKPSSVYIMRAGTAVSRGLPVEGVDLKNVTVNSALNLDQQSKRKHGQENGNSCLCRKR
jgi:hypothetical protein